MRLCGHTSAGDRDLLFFAMGLAAFALWGQFMDMGTIFLLNFGSLLFNLVVSGIAWFASCCFNSSAPATSVGAALDTACDGSCHSVYSRTCRIGKIGAGNAGLYTCGRNLSDDRRNDNHGEVSF